MQRALLLALPVLLSSAFFRAEAALTGPTIAKDNLFELDISWGWNPEGSGGSIPTLQNWDVFLSITGGQPLWTATVQVFHDTNPHPNLGERIGDLATLTGSFPDTGPSAFGLVISRTTSVDHGSIHQDTYTFTFDRSMAPQNTFIRLVGNHPCDDPPNNRAQLAASPAQAEACPVPEPSAAWLLSAGLAASMVCSAFARRRIGASQDTAPTAGGV